ncbi:MAG: hypothetical protein COA42_12430 [Alteromonadaceae bacterium]|nr:MAG: hypothetical protein COA42_12430 [Alteromonadaceae bacterium]
MQSGLIKPMHKTLLTRLQTLLAVFILLLASGLSSASSEDSDASSIQTIINPNLQFKVYDDPTLLSVGEISAIAQDEQGFMWFGGNKGLVRYDGYTFKPYTYEQSDRTTVSTNSITDLLVHQGHLWVATYWGLNRFDPASGGFKRFNHSADDPQSISHNSITKLTVDAHGRLWVGTAGNGLNRYNTETESFKRFTHDTNNDSSIASNTISALFGDSKGLLWLGYAGKGADLFDPLQGNVIERFRHKPKDDNSLSHNHIVSINEDLSGAIWLGTDGLGVNQYIPESNKMIRHIWKSERDQGYEHAITSNHISDIFSGEHGSLWFAGGGAHNLATYRWGTGDFQRYSIFERHSQRISTRVFRDASGGLWVGFMPNGLARVDRYASTFENLHSVPGSANSLNSSIVLSLSEDQQGNLLVGTQSGFNHIDRATGNVTSFEPDGDNPYSITTESISSILPINEHEVLLGTPWLGIDRLNLATGQVTQNYTHDKNDPNSLAHREVWSLFKDRDNEIWIGGNGGALHRWRRDSDDFQRFQLRAPHKPKPGRVLIIEQDHLGDFWYGTDDGLFRSPQQERTEDSLKLEYFSPEGEQTIKPHRWAIRSIREDPLGNMWFGTEGGGAHYWDRERDTYRVYTIKEGIAHNSVVGILIDNDDMVWFSTGNGISRFNPKTQKFTNYSKDHGLLGNNFNHPAYFKTRNGELVFGSVDGVTIIKQDNMFKNTYIPPTMVTDFLIFNKSVPVERFTSPTFDAADVISPLKGALSHIKTITLDHTQSVFSFRMAALNFDIPSKNQYKYKLDGFDQDWNLIGNRRIATYTNIDPGHYIFQIKSANNEGLWNEIARTIKLTILPPWWATWWARLLYGIVFLSLIALVFYTHLQQKRTKDEQQLNKKLRDLNTVKDAFLANTSHELRTPLNGIIGLSESLIEGVAGPLPQIANTNLAMIANSGKRLSHLVNDILDFSKLKERSIKLNIQAVDLYSISDTIMSVSAGLINAQSIKLINKINRYQFYVLADEDRLQQILYNLIGNAIKFTHEGAVTLSAEAEGELLWIRVNDTGIGIAPDQQGKIFRAFEQIDSSDGRCYGGTGLGLTVTKQLIELHKGQLKVESELGQGSTFSFALKISHDKKANNINTKPSVDDNTRYSPDQAIIESEATHLTGQLSAAEKSSNIKNNDSPKTTDTNGFHILIVDDEPVNRQVIKNLLSLKHYRISECIHGEQALEFLQATDGSANQVDMILLDIMMPRMSGYEVCKKLRETKTQDSLPILFLTAKSQIDDLAKGYEVGGNDFLTKPVDKKELFARVNTHLNLLSINRQLQTNLGRLKQTQSQLVHAEKMSSLSTLVAGLAHEINNPSNMTQTSAYNLDRKLKEFKLFLIELAGDDNEEVIIAFEEKFGNLASDLSSMHEGNSRIKALIEGFRLFSRLDESKYKCDHLAAGIRSCVNIVKSSYGESVNFSFVSGDDPELFCHAAQLNQVFMNMMINACQAIIEKQIWDKQTPREKGLVTVSMTSNQPQGSMTIEIKDSGCGMSGETIKKMFDPFYTTREVGEGAGLGLSIAYGIVEQHKGHIEVTSDKGYGTSIKVQLPIML